MELMKGCLASVIGNVTVMLTILPANPSGGWDEANRFYKRQRRPDQANVFRKAAHCGKACVKDRAIQRYSDERSWTCRRDDLYPES